MGVLKDITGQRFGRLLVVRRAENNKHKAAMWVCLCTCGIEKVVLGDNLRLDIIRSCGCLSAELSAERCRKQPPRLRHGHASVGQMTAEYQSYSHAKSRCNNPN